MEPFSKYNIRDKISNFISPSTTKKSKSEKMDKEIGKEKIISSKKTEAPEIKSTAGKKVANLGKGKELKKATAQVKSGSLEEKFSKLTPREFLFEFTASAEKAKNSMNPRLNSEEEKLMSSRPMKLVNEAREGFKHVKMTDEDRKSMDTLMETAFKALEDRRNRTLPEGFIGGVGSNEKYMQAIENLDARVDTAIDSLNEWLYTHD